MYASKGVESGADPWRRCLQEQSSDALQARRYTQPCETPAASILRMTDPAEPLDWRAVLALLANPETRAALAELSTGTHLTTRTRAAALAKLAAVGLVESAADGSPLVAEGRLRATLRHSASPSVTGPERFLSRGGRLTDYPARAADRTALLELIVARVVAPGESLSERELGGRLAGFTDDVATLRRYLVDAGLLSRLGDGSGYRLTR